MNPEKEWIALMEQLRMPAHMMQINTENLIWLAQNLNRLNANQKGVYKALHRAHELIRMMLAERL